MRLYRAWILALSVVALAACATGSGGDRDAGLRRDSGSLPGVDSGPLPGVDSGPGFDAGAFPEDGGIGEDGGPIGVDGGPGDLCIGVDCSSLTTGCVVGVCDPASGACTTTSAGDGTGCDDGNLCTTGDACSGGTCGGTPRDCSSMATECSAASCDPATGACVATPLAEGMACGTPSGCTSSTCRSGTCTPAPTADCGSCGGGMYCAGGTCGPSPTSLSYGFESGTLPTGWTNGIGGTAGWTIEASGAHSGTYRARSGAIGHSAQSRMGFTITLASASTLSFWLTTSTESCCDHLYLYVDGVQQGSWQGTTAWTQAAVPLAAGTRTIEWRYTKDGSVVSGSDAVWIDDVVIGGASDPGTDFEGGTLPPGYSTSGSASWSVMTGTVHGGSYAAGSGTITDSQTTSMTRTVAVPSASTLTFWYRVSSEGSFDYLRVFVDGTQQGQWSGDVPWAMASIALAAGSHTVEWRYSKDGSVSTGSDRAWVDDISFGFTPTSSPLCGP